MATENVIQMQQKTSSGSFDTYYPVGFVGQEVTLTASGWNSSATQAVTVSFPITNIENEELIVPMPKQAYIEAWAQSGIKLLSVTTAGVCTFKYTGTAPDADIQLVVAKAGMTSGGGVTEPVEVWILNESIDVSTFPLICYSSEIPSPNSNFLIGGVAYDTLYANWD